MKNSFRVFVTQIDAETLNNYDIIYRIMNDTQQHIHAVMYGECRH